MQINGKNKQHLFGFWLRYLVPALLVALFIGFTEDRIFNWGQAEDFVLVDVYRRFFLVGDLSIVDILSHKNGPHPFGFQLLLTIFLFDFIGVNFNALVVANIALSGSCAVFLSGLVCSNPCSRYVKFVTPVLLSAVYLHPSQMNHLLWPFELGWFMVNLSLVVNLVLIERLRAGALPWVVTVCLLGTFSTGQGAFLWLLAGFHFLLIGGQRRYLTFSGFMVVFVGLSAYLSLSSGEVSDLMKGGVGGLIVYYVQLFGAVFGVRDPTNSFILGGLVLGCALGLSFNVLLSEQPLCSHERVALVLVAGALIMAAGFTLARYKFGIAWAFDRFHAAPLLVSLMAGIVIFSTRCFEKNVSMIKRCVFILAQIALVLSFQTTLAYASERLEMQSVFRAFSMALECSKADDPLLQTSAAGLGKTHLHLLSDNREILSQLCSDELPPNTKALLKVPVEFTAQMLREPSSKEGIQALWRVYQMHGDLQRAFPVQQLDLARNLIMFASNNAKTGSQYEKDILGPHADLYVRLHNAH